MDPEDTDPHEPPASTPEQEGPLSPEEFEEKAREYLGYGPEELKDDHSGTVTVKMYLEAACSASRSTLGASGLTGQEFRFLWALVQYATFSNTEGNRPLSNCFPKRKRIAGALGLDERSVDNLRVSVERKGWIRVHPMIHPKEGRQMSSLYQFCIPPIPEDPSWSLGWVGPLQFSHREESAQVVPEDHYLRRRRTGAK